jgi:hypothetical protein
MPLAGLTTLVSAPKIRASATCVSAIGTCEVLLRELELARGYER